MSDLAVDWTRCAARGACIDLLPDLLAEDDWGYPLARQQGTWKVPVSAEQRAIEAVAVCPRRALALRVTQGEPCLGAGTSDVFDPLSGLGI
jgi:ferredoxin